MDFSGLAAAGCVLGILFFFSRVGRSAASAREILARRGMEEGPVAEQVPDAAEAERAARRFGAEEVESMRAELASLVAAFGPGTASDPSFGAACERMAELADALART